MAPTAPQGDLPHVPPPRRRVRLERVTCSGAPDGQCRVAVELEWCGETTRLEARALDTPEGRVRGSAEATLGAALAVVGEQLRLELVGVKAFRAFDGWVVVVRVLGGAGDRSFRLLGAASAEDEGGAPRASAEAVLDAINRVAEGHGTV